MSLLKGIDLQAHGFTKIGMEVSLPVMEVQLTSRLIHPAARQCMLGVMRCYKIPKI